MCSDAPDLGPRSDVCSDAPSIGRDDVVAAELDDELGPERQPSAFPSFSEMR